MLRRKILKSAAAAAVCGLSFSALGSARLPEENYDVIVVGSGAAGLSAAVAAREAGAAKVAVLEKLALVGGHSLVSSGSVSVAFRRPGTADPMRDLRKMASEMRLAGGPSARADLIEALVADSESVVRRLKELGVRWDKHFFTAVGALSARNISTGSPQAGYDYVQVLTNRAKSLGVEFFLSTRATGLIEHSQRITGVLAVRTSTPALAGAMPENFTAPGEPMRISAGSVILATGGFTANPAMRTFWNPAIPADLPTTANPERLFLDGATGDGIHMAQSVNAELVDMAAIQLIPYSGGRLLDRVGGEIWVNDTGRRFIAEGSTFGKLRTVLPEDEGFWAISDSQTSKSSSLARKLMQGTVRAADSVEELADAIGVNRQTLRQTIERWNSSVAEGTDLDFNVPIRNGSAIRTPPFFFGREAWSVHFTCGGIAITAYGEVLRSDGSVIEGLYAAGETTGGVHGQDRLGGNSLTDCFVFGSRAGRRAVANALEVARNGQM